MAKTKISDFDIDPANNTDINSINIAEGCAPSGINNAIRQLMSDLKEFQTGAGGDSITATGVYSDTIGEKTSAAGVTVDGVLLKDNAVTASGGFSGALNGTVGATTPNTGAFTTLSASGAFSANGGATLGDASGDALTINSSAVSIPNGLNFDSNTLVIDATNNRIGIGTASPSDTLTVAGNATLSVSQPAYGLTDTSNSNYKWIVQNLSSALRFYDITAGSERMRITSTGNVGIGTSSPAATNKVQVQQSSTTDGATAIVASCTGVTTGTNYGLYSSVSGATVRNWGLYVQAGDAYVAGNVGIGTSSPTQKLTLSLADLGGISYGDRTFTGTYYLGTTSGAGNAFGGNSTYIGFAGTGTSAADIIIQPNAGNTIFRTGSSTEVMRLNSSGNLGLGVTPSAWGSGFKAFEVGFLGNGLFGVGSTSLQMTSNYYYNGTNYIYSANGYAARYHLNANAGQHLWFTAPSGTAGNAITFTQAMTLDASGNLGIGTTSPAKQIDVQTANNTTVATIQLRDSQNRTVALSSPTSTADAEVGTTSNHDLIVRAGASGGSSINMRFNTVGTERMRIDSSGKLLVGKTSSATANTGVELQPGTGGNAAGVFTADGATTLILNRLTSDGTIVDIRRSGSTVGSISVTTTATAYNTSSDYRLKENVAPMTGALAKNALLKPVTYTWKADGSVGEGFIAHELAEVMPQAVTGEKDAVNEDGTIKPQGIDTSFLVGHLVACIQELKAEVDSLKAQLNK